MPETERQQAIIVAASLALLGATLALLIYTEPVAARFWFAVAITAAIASTGTLLSRRLLFSSIVTFSLVVLILLVSHEKRNLMNMALHSYDLFFYLNAGVFEFLWNDYRSYVAPVIAMLAVTAGVAALAWRFDATRLPRAASAFVLTVGVAAAAAFQPEASAASTAWDMLSKKDSFVSAFYLSWGETWRTLRRGQLMEAAADVTLPDFTRQSKCSPSAKPPHIVLIHQESIVPPSLFPTLAYDRALDPFFLSADGQLHKLRVETYGGGSWVTEFALLSGISTKAFGNMAMFVQVLMQGRLKETLIQALKRCGYRTLVLFPMNKKFVSLSRFYYSIGFSKIMDRKDQNAPTTLERDRFYFQNALNAMERHFEASDQPLFVYVQTMASHGPYDETYMPEEIVPGGGPGTSAAMSEYLRRVAMAKMDGDFLMSEIKRRFPGESILVVRYGDHQPNATREFISEQWWSGENAEARERVGPDPYVTFYAMTTHNYPFRPLPDYDVLDVPYLGTAILEAAGLPLSEAQKERKRLMTVCDGHYFDCKQRDEILVFQRRLINSGLVRLP